MPIIVSTNDAIVMAAKLICEGGLVAMPTETVYGLAADATNPDAVLAIYAAKGRPRFNPLIIHVAQIEDAWRIGQRSPLAETLAAHFWPGPLTLVLPALVPNGIADLATAGLDTVAVRVPAHPVARALIVASGRPIAAPSANRSGHVSPTQAGHVRAELGADVMILDGGPCDRGLESTIISVVDRKLCQLRAGSLTVADIAAAVGWPVSRLDGDKAADVALLRPSAPGQLSSHYAPSARLRLNAADVSPGEALLAFGPAAPPSVGPVINLSPTGDLREAAKNLFGALRTLDQTGVTSIAAMPVPLWGLGEAINDRLTRAAAPR